MNGSENQTAMVRISRGLRRGMRMAAAIGLVTLSVQIQAATTDLSSAPLVTSSSSTVLPNLMFILDDSGSMNWTYMPDTVNNFRGAYGYSSSQCNGVYYDPAVTYSPPVSSTGASYSNASFTAAWVDGFDTSAGTVNLSTSFRVDADLSSQAAFYYTYSGSQTSAAQKDYYNTSGTFYRECNSNIGSTPGSSVFNKVTVSSTSGPGATDERTNFANWYSYYRKRMLMMKTAAGRAFLPIDNHYRVGFMSINNNTSADFLNFATFDSTHKADWYAKLYGANTGNSTPLREALSNAGKIYAGKVSTFYGQTVNDPVQYSCQQNFTLLSTDGFWNGNAGSKLDGTAVGHQDSVAPRPYNDGGSVTYARSTSQVQQSRTQISRFTSQQQSRTEQIQSQYSNLQRQTTQLQTRTSTLQQQISQLQTRTNQLQERLSTLQQRTSQLQQRNYSQLQTRTSSNSGSTWSGWSDTTSCTFDTNGSSRRDCRYNGTSWSAFSNVSTCDAQAVGTGTTNGTTWRSGVECQWASWSAWADTASCTAVAQDTSDPYNGNSGTSGVARECQYSAYGPWSNVSSCTSVAQDTTNPYSVPTARQCQWSGWSGWSGVNSCTTVSQDTSDPYTGNSGTGGVARACQTAVTTPYADVASCTVDTSPDASGYTTQCQYSAWSSWSGVPSCTAVAASSGPTNYTVATARQCQSAVTSAFTNASSCTVTTIPDASGNTTQCQYTGWGSWTNTSSCTPVTQSTGPAYTVGTGVQCQTTDTGWVGASSCTPSVSGGRTITCQTVTTGPTLVASCTAQSAASGNSWTQTTCSTATIEPTTGVSACTPVTPSAANSYTGTYCNTVTTGPSNVAACTAEAASVANSWTTTTCTGPTSSGGVADTLSDVAYYYYTTDLRTSALGNATGALGNNVADNNVPTSGLDTASWQHMTTFTLGLGARGRMIFSSTYLSDTSGDYFAVKNGSTASSSVCTWQTSGSACNWPSPGSDQIENIDDLWHAAVNGRGSYFSATNPTSLSTAISTALAGVSARSASSAAATTSNPNVTSGDNFVFESTFMTVEWTGELTRRQLDLSTGRPLPTVDWSARDQLDANSARTIYTFDASAGNKLKPFLWANLSATQQVYFSLANLATLTQFCASGTNCLSAAAQAAAAGSPLVSFLRGDRSNEGALSDTSKYFRQRSHVLGDIVNAEAVYVKSSLFNYADTGYSTFATGNRTRQGMVYTAANDGMLHAFNSDTGVEAWAYVPSMVLPSMYKLADKDYANRHQFFLDGTPIVGEISVGGVWRTILVGGMNAGGRGYYALDVTDPAAPAALWEFTDTNLGYTYGNPVITKLKDGTWVVLVSSGYNNVASGDGLGRLYVLNAATGAVIRSISTGVGSTTTPSGLARITAWVDSGMVDNTTERVYGGDLLGNVWRFDVNNDIGAAGYDAHLLVTLLDSTGTPQPITTKPQIGECSDTPVVLVGTGRFLGTSDLASTQQQSFYGIRDALDTASLSNPRVVSSGFVQQTETSGVCPNGAAVCAEGELIRSGTSHAVSYPTNNGWYLDFIDSGERANTDPTLVLGTLTFNTNVPGSSACTIGGYSYINYLNYCTGAPISTAGTASNSQGIAGVKLGNALATRPAIIVLPNHLIVSLTRMSDGTTVTTNPPPPTSSGNTRRVSWRELVSDQ